MTTLMIRRCHSSASNTMYQYANTRRFSTNLLVMKRPSAAAAVVSSTTVPHLKNRSTFIDKTQRCSCCRHPRTCHRHHQLYCRNMSSHSSNSVEPDWVRTAIQKMIMDQQQQSETSSGGETITTSNNVPPPLPSSSNSSSERNTVPGMNGSVKLTPVSTGICDNSDLEKSLLSLQVGKLSRHPP
jgi:hypothetical protein